MTADPNSIDLPALLETHLQQAEPDLLRSMLTSFVQALMSAEADAVCGADYGTRTAARVNRPAAPRSHVQPAPPRRARLRCTARRAPAVARRRR